MDSAQGCSSAADEGRHEKILSRVGVSETPATAVGPVIIRFERCGSAVMP